MISSVLPFSRRLVPTLSWLPEVIWPDLGPGLIGRAIDHLFQQDHIPFRRGLRRATHSRQECQRDCCACERPHLHLSSPSLPAPFDLVIKRMRAARNNT